MGPIREKTCKLTRATICVRAFKLVILMFLTRASACCMGARARNLMPSHKRVVVQQREGKGNVTKAENHQKEPKKPWIKKKEGLTSKFARLCNCGQKHGRLAPKRELNKFCSGLFWFGVTGDKRNGKLSGPGQQTETVDSRLCRSLNWHTSTSCSP